MKIKRATLKDLSELSILLDLYRQFYEQKSDLAGAQKFLEERITKNESVIFIAHDSDHNFLGFTQLYPTFSSVRLKRQWILNDLFVAVNSRQAGIGEALVRHAMEFAKGPDIRGLTLQTAKTNLSAQKLYEKLGWKRSETFYSYIFDNS